MIYLIYGKEQFIIEKEIKKILKINNITELSISTYDLNETPLENILEDATTISLFSENKAIIINNSFIFTGKKGTIEQNTNNLEHYLQTKILDTILIFTTNDEKLDERKKLVKTIKQIGKVIEVNSINNLNSIIKEQCEDYQINPDTIELLINRVGKNLGIIEQEIEKIKTYKGTDKNITKEDVLSLTNENIDIDIFGLIENIVNKNNAKAIKIYHEMLKYNEEPIKILVMLANQFRIIYQAKEMFKKGFTETDIASTLNIHPYRIKLALGKSRGYDSSVLLQHLEKLADLDIAIKKGAMDKEIGLELFIINI